MKAIVFDCETTGLLLPSSAPIENQPRIIEFGGVVVEDGKISSTFNWLINPGCEITPEITKITGIKNEDLKDQPAFKDIIEDIKAIFKMADMWVAHNASFDVGMLKVELELAGCSNFHFPPTIVCTVQENIYLFGRRPKLTELYELTIGKPLAQTHRALDDAMAVYEIIMKQEFFKQLGHNFDDTAEIKD